MITGTSCHKITFLDTGRTYFHFYIVCDPKIESRVFGWELTNDGAIVPAPVIFALCANVPFAYTQAVYQTENELYGE